MDLNKRLTEIKTIIPEVNNDLSDQIYRDYKQSNTIIKSKKYPTKRLALVFSTMIVMIVCIVSISLLLNYNKNEIFYNDTKLLTNVVYNTTVKKNEKYQIVSEGKIKRFSNNFHYSSLTIHRSYGFEVTFDFVMTPYFDNYVIGDKVDVIIAMIDLHGGNTGGYPLAQDMIIFRYKDQIYGFLSPTARIINELNPRDEKELDFGSYIFLTKDAVVKYYERGDYIYSFDLIESDNQKIELNAIQSKAFDSKYGENKYNVNILEDSYVELNSGDVIDLVNLSLVETVEVEALITSIDLVSGKIYIRCESVPSLQSITYSFSIVDESGNLYQITDLEKGDVIKIYFYQRYKNYSPVNIRVENIILK